MAGPDSLQMRRVPPAVDSCATLSAMRAVVRGLVAIAWGLALVAPAAAAPPEDVAAFCRAAYPSVQVQVRCLMVERAAAERVVQSAATADPDTVGRCHAGSLTWTVMESCLAGADPGRAPAETAALPPGERRDAGEAASPAAGPPAVLPAVAAEPERPTIPIPEADADRHLRRVLEREGHRTARCTKKQYWPGWVSICY
jgi:hypothetical protein